MKYILILLISFAFSQVPFVPIGMGEEKNNGFVEESTVITTSWELAKDNADNIVSILKSSRMVANAVKILAKNQSKFISIDNINKYAEECYKTKSIEVCADDDDGMDLYKWRMIVNQMARNGYYITDKSMYDDCVLFKKQPTLPGFIEWLKE